MTDEPILLPPILLADDPAPHIRRLTLNRPSKRNALSNALRGAIFAALEAADKDPDVRVIILRGAGTCFSSGYDLSSLGELPFHTAGGQGQWARHVVEGCFRMWDLSKPIIAQVHGWCLAGGSELAVACDLVYVAHDAQIGYPAVRTLSPPDNQYHAWIVGMRAAMELLLTGDAFDGDEAVRLGFANRAFAADDLEAQVLAWRSGSPRSTRNWPSSTSAWSTARWRPWACARACGPAPTSTPWAGTPPLAASIWVSCARA